MILYKRYISIKIILSFVSIALLLITLIWLSRTITFLKYITENGVEFKQMFVLFGLMLPWLLIFIIPISLFAAILVTYNRLLLNNEIAVLQSSGLSRIEIAKPVFSIAILATITCFVMSFYLMPYANKKLRLARVDFTDNYSNISFSESSFETLKNLTIYIKSKDEKNNLFGILLNDKRNNSYSLTITARTGKLAFEDHKLLLYVEDGTLQRFNNKDKKTEILNFDDYIFNLSENNLRESDIIRWKAKERFVNELINPKEESISKADLDRYRVEIHQRLTYPLMSIILSIIAVAFILRGHYNRKGNINNIVLGVLLASIFFLLTITFYRLIESMPNLTFLLYLNFVFFLTLGIKMLITNHHK